MPFEPADRDRLNSLPLDRLLAELDLYYRVEERAELQLRACREARKDLVQLAMPRMIAEHGFRAVTPKGLEHSFFVYPDRKGMGRIPVVPEWAGGTGKDDARGPAGSGPPPTTPPGRNDR